MSLFKIKKVGNGSSKNYKAIFIKVRLYKQENPIHQISIQVRSSNINILHKDFKNSMI